MIPPICEDVVPDRGSESVVTKPDAVSRAEAKLAGQSIVDVLEAAPDGLVLVRVDGTMAFVNRQMESLFGYARDEMVGQSIEVLLPEGVRGVHRERRHGYVEEPRVRSMGSGLDLWARRRDGSEFPVEISLSPMSAGDESLVIASVRDITAQRGGELERRRLLAELKTSEEEFRLAFDQAPIAMARTSLNDPQRLVIESANQALADFLKYSPEDLVGRSFADLTHPDDRTADVLAAAALANGGHDVVREKRYIASDGCTVWGELHASSVVSPDGELFSLSHIVDIGERKRREAEQQRQARFLDALGQVSDGLLDGATGPDAFDLICDHAARLLDATGAEIGDTHQAERAESIRSPLRLPDGTSVILNAFRRSGLAHFEPGARELLARFCEQASLALELAEARAAQSRTAVLEDRDRIARDLHDRVIQRLFGAGMGIQSLAGSLTNPAVRLRLDTAVDEIDLAIKELRTAIFTLTLDHDEGLRAQVVHLASEWARTMGMRPSITFDGVVDHLDVAVVDHATATINEALSNVARHANATRVDVRVAADNEMLTVRVIDNGDGIAEDHSPGNGLKNMLSRARQLGGECTMLRNRDKGSTVEWRVPTS